MFTPQFEFQLTKKEREELKSYKTTRKKIVPKLIIDIGASIERY